MKLKHAHTLLRHATSSLMLLVAVCLSHVCQPVSANSDIWFGTLHRPDQGQGTEEDPYLITNAEQMAFLMQNYDYSIGTYNHKYYRLTTDLDMQWTKWRFGTAQYDSRSFRGHFDGAGHKISNLQIRASHCAFEDHIGLFAQLGGDDEFESVIENLELDSLQIVYEENRDVSMPSKQYVMGGLVGQMYRNSRIENCIIRGMTVSYAGSRLDFGKDQFLKVGPLVGDIQERFGERVHGVQVPSAQIIHSYGKLEVAQPGEVTGNIEVQTQQGQIYSGEYHGYTWHKIAGNQFSFAPCDVDLYDARPTGDQHNTVFAARVSQEAQGKPLTYRWYEGTTPLQGSGAEITLDPMARPRSLSCEVYDAQGALLGADAIFVHPAYAELVVTHRQTGTGTYNLTAQLKAYRAEILARDFVYSWRDMTDGGKEVGTSVQLTGARQGHTYQVIAHHRRWKFYTFSQWQSFTQPIYVSLHGISEAQRYTYTTDGKTYPAGDDSHDGSTPEQAVRTLKRAYELLHSRAEGATMAHNVIVIMGEYDQPVFNDQTDATHRNPDYFRKDKPAVILGKYGNITGGSLLFSSEFLQMDEETTFENLVLHGADLDGRRDTDLAVVYANDHNLTFGYGLRLTNYRSIDSQRGLINGSHAPHFTIYGGFLNLDEPDYQYREHTIKVQSGYFGRVIAGNRYTRPAPRSGQVTGSPRFPLRTHLVIDVCNAINDPNKPYDVALVVGGQGDGSLFATNQIDILGTSMVGRIIGGNIGFGRPGGSLKGTERPSDSFFGQTEINVRSGIVNEIYGSSLGRLGLMLHPEMKDQLIDSCVTYFYGKSVINISGGMIRNTIYGAGCGGASGLDGDDGRHTFDPHIPYMLSNGQVSYGRYKEAKGKMPRIYVSGDSVIDLNQTSVSIRISGNSHLRGKIYGGGYGFSNQMQTCQATSQAGCLFGDSYVEISGGRIDGDVFGGGRGNLGYFDNHDCSGYPLSQGVQQDQRYFAATAQIHGDTHISISGGEIHGRVFGAGQGTYYRPTSATDPTNLAQSLAAVYGSTHVDISGHALCHGSIYGGGNYGDVCKGQSSRPDAGSTYVNIRGGRLMNAIFGAGQGHYVADCPERSVICDIEGDTHVSITGGEFVWAGQSTSDTEYDLRRCYGIFGSGRTASIVHGDAFVEAHRSLFSHDFLQQADLLHWNHDKAWEGIYTLCGGGYGWASDVMGDTHVNINVDQAPKFNHDCFIADDLGQSLETIPYLSFMDVFGGGLRGHVHGSTHVIVEGTPYIRNLYGGGLAGNCGVRDMVLNGDLYTPDYKTRDYTTRTTIQFLSGASYRIFGGSLMGHIGGEVELNIGSPTDSIANDDIMAYMVYGGNDVTGTIAGSNNPNYGVHINMYGGEIRGNLYGGGNGLFEHYFRPVAEGDATDFRNVGVGRERPHVASTSVSIGGISEQHRAQIFGNLFMGGNNTTIGLFSNDTPAADTPQGISHETLIPNSGRIRCNIASHCHIDSLVMGANGSQLFTYIPEYQHEGRWYRGFPSDHAFLQYCRHIDISCVPQLTFNADRAFHNQHVIDDRRGNMRKFETPGEMDAIDVSMNTFIGGGFCGSMTSDSVLNYTLPPGLFLRGTIIGGSCNPTFSYIETEGPETGRERTFIGGVHPYDIDNEQYHRIQLNIFCQFEAVRETTDPQGQPSHTGARIFGGCYDRGVVLGATSINLHSSLLGQYDKDIDMFHLATQMNTEGGHIYGAGKGEESEVIGNTYVALKGCTFNGQRLMPAALNVFGGGMQGQVIGRANVQVDIEAPDCSGTEASFYAIYGKVYGGGRIGGVLMNSKSIPGLTAQARGANTHVTIHSGHIQEVFGGSRMGIVEGGSWVDIDDRAQWHGHTVITNVYGGNDITGSLGYLRVRPEGLTAAVRTNTYVHITESPKADSTYTGFPFIGNLYGGGNGRYGAVDADGRYIGGTLQTAGNEAIQLAGMARPDVDSTYIDMTGGTVWNLYGGANAAQVHDYSMIRLDVRDTTARATFDRILSPECYTFGANMYHNTRSPEGWLFDDTRMKARYNVNRVFGGNNYSDMNIQPTWQLISGKIGTIYGGCNSGDVLYYNERGDRLAAVGTKTEIVEPGLVLPLNSDRLYVDNVYGGSRMGTVRASHLRVDSLTGRRDTIPVTFADNQYGTNIFIGAGQYGRVFGGNDVSGTIQNGTRISMEGGVVREIYGAGNGDYYYQVSTEVRKATETWDPVDRRWFYRVPLNPRYSNPKTPGINKILSINDARPNCNKCYVEIAGGVRPDHSRQTAYVTGAIYAGGLSSTICGPERTDGVIRLDIGNYSTINQLYMGSNGERLTSRTYMDRLFEYNGITDLDEVSTRDHSLIYCYMNAVAMHGLPRDFQLHRTYDQTHIGSFFVGGNHASLLAHGSLTVNFPVSLVVFDKIVGGSNQADFTYERDDIEHPTLMYQGGIGWDGIDSKPQVTLNVNCQFRDRILNMDPQYAEQQYLPRRDDFDEEDTSPRVYSGCFGSGSVDGDIITNISDMSY